MKGIGSEIKPKCDLNNCIFIQELPEIEKMNQETRKKVRFLYDDLKRAERKNEYDCVEAIAYAIMEIEPHTSMQDHVYIWYIGDDNQPHRTIRTCYEAFKCLTKGYWAITCIPSYPMETIKMEDESDG